ncbi:hypothetical protein TNCV_2288311 [Trichonephila clavipes]|nr:hypothetical protein TNCV_2288311 [Trichonephila clavipes]
MPTVSISVLVTLGAEEYRKMFKPVDKYDARNPVLSFQTKELGTHLSTHSIDERPMSTLPSPRTDPQTIGVGGRYANTWPLGFNTVNYF